MSSEAKTNNAIIIGSSTDASSSSLSLQPKTETKTVETETKKIISDEKYNYGAPSWNNINSPGTITDTDKASRKGTANIWQERVPAPSDEEEGADYVYVRNEEDGEVTFDAEFGLLGKTSGTKSNKEATGTSGPAWTRSNAWSSIATYR